MLVYHKSGHGMLDLNLATRIARHSDTQIYVEIELHHPARSMLIRDDYRRAWGEYYKSAGYWIVNISLEQFIEREEETIIVDADFTSTTKKTE